MIDKICFWINKNVGWKIIIPGITLCGLVIFFITLNTYDDLNYALQKVGRYLIFLLICFVAGILFPSLKKNKN